MSGKIKRIGSLWYCRGYVRSEIQEVPQTISALKYYFIGGMPEAVNAYVCDGNYDEARSIQNEILALYENDFSKHIESRTELERTRMVWNGIPLSAYKDFSAYKLFMPDVGLLCAMSGPDAKVYSPSLKAYVKKFNPKKAVRFSLLGYKEQEWMTNIPLYAVCNL